MQPDRDAVQSDGPPIPPTGVTADKPGPSPFDPAFNTDVSLKGGPWRWWPLVFVSVGAVSGFAVMMLCCVACTPPAGWGNSEDAVTYLERWFLACGAIVGAFIGWILAVLWVPRRRPPPRIDVIPRQPTHE